MGTPCATCPTGSTALLHPTTEAAATHNPSTPAPLKSDVYFSTQSVRWCPGRVVLDQSTPHQ